MYYYKIQFTLIMFFQDIKYDMICFYNLFDKIFSEVVLIRSKDKALHMNLFSILTFSSKFGYGCQRGEIALYGGR